MRFLLALVVVGLVVYFITARAPSPMARNSGERDTSSATQATTTEPRAASTTDDLRRDVAGAGETLKEKARAAGERIDDARIITVIKSKFALDTEISASAISVSCQDGRVVLDGAVPSQEIADRALQQAQATDGVQTVVSHLTVGAAPGR